MAQDAQPDAPLANPFLAAEPAGVVTSASEPSAPEASSNPFLAPEPAPPAAAPQPSQPRVVPPSPGAPLQVQPGAIAPSVKDPHAEFRKGGWKKPALFGALAAVVGGGLFFGIPERSEEEPPAYAASAEAQAPAAVIGTSVSPEIIKEPERPIRAKAEPQAPVEQPASPERPDRSDDFASSFKSAAK